MNWNWKFRAVWMLCLGVNDMSKEMKNSGFEWIGDIPEEWNLIRLCNVTQNIFLGRTPIYSENENNNFIVGQKNNQANGIDFSDIKYGEESFYSQREEKEFLKYGDILLNTLGGGSVGRIGYWNIKNNKKYITDGHLMVIRAKKNYDAKFLYYAMMSQQQKLEDDAVGSTNQAFLTVSQVYKNIIASPRYEIQKRLARFLDEKLKKIDFIIVKTEKSIEDYKKLKQSIITQAVTTGIKSNCLMKKTAVGWLIEVPDRWTVQKGKHLFVETNERSVTGEEELLTVSHITGVTPRKNKNVNMFMSESLVDYKICHEGDIAANTMWMWQGAIGVSKYHGVISPSYNTYRQRSDIYDSDYLEYLLRVPPLVDTYAAYSTGITASRLRLYPQGFFSIYFPVPPKREQQEIASYLNKKIPQINQLIVKKEKFIDELKNYKRSLVYEYVTGKKEVPES